MKKLRHKIISTFFIYLLIVIISAIYLAFTFVETAFPYILISFLFWSVLFIFFLRWNLLKMESILKKEMKGLIDFMETGKPYQPSEGIFEPIYQEIIIKMERILSIIKDFSETNNVIKSRINDVIYSFDQLLSDYKGFNEKFYAMMDKISGVTKEKLDIQIEDKLQSFVMLTVEISKFREQLLFLVDRVKDIVNDYIVRTSEDIKNANVVLKGFLSFVEGVVNNSDKIILYLNNINSYAVKLNEELGKIVKHKEEFKERVEVIRDNFDSEKEILDEVIGLNRTTKDIFYDLKTLLIEVSKLNKKASLMSLNALIYASESGGDTKRFGMVAKELKRFVEEIDKKFNEIEDHFSKIFESNNRVLKLLSDYESIAVEDRMELSKMAIYVNHLSHHIDFIKQSVSKITEPVEEQVAIINDTKDRIVNHSSALKEVLTIFKDYMDRLEKAEKDRESFDSLVVATSGLLEYINNNLPSLTSYITGIFKTLEEFALSLEDSNKIMRDFLTDETIRDFGKLLGELQVKRLEGLRDSLVLLEKTKNARKII